MKIQIYIPKTCNSFLGTKIFSYEKKDESFWQKKYEILRKRHKRKQNTV